MGDKMASDDPNRPEAAGNSTASSLLNGAKRYDARAWEQLVDRYSGLVYHWCRQSGLAAEDSGDLLQAVMLKVSQHLPRFEKDGRPAAFRRWLATVTRTSIADHLRKNRDQPHGSGGTDALMRLHTVPAPCGTDSSASPILRQDNRQLERLLDQIEAAVNASTWQAFQLTVFEHLTSAEAGARLQMTPAAVRLAKGRVLQRLRKGIALETCRPTGESQ